ncbi:MAG TPA: type I-C CRISPR-associated protein Cas5, partial [Burkholderiaceae bacterium]|nr:type I-C CRISPR-associated protein Cas5 [Burkholderiaceae bacterium]
ARVRLVTSPGGEPEPQAGVDGDFGWMLYDMDFSRPNDPRPMFFRAQLTRGVLDLTQAEVRS